MVLGRLLTFSNNRVEASYRENFARERAGIAFWYASFLNFMAIAVICLTVARRRSYTAVELRYSIIFILLRIATALPINLVAKSGRWPLYNAAVWWYRVSRCGLMLWVFSVRDVVNSCSNVRNIFVDVFAAQVTMQLSMPLVFCHAVVLHTLAAAVGAWTTLSPSGWCWRLLFATNDASEVCAKLKHGLRSLSSALDWLSVIPLSEPTEAEDVWTTAAFWMVFVGLVLPLLLSYASECRSRTAFLAANAQVRPLFLTPQRHTSNQPGAIA